MRTNRIRIAAAFVPAVAALLAGLVALMATSEAGALAKAQAAWEGIDVVHAKFVAESGAVVSEEWLDRRTGATRRVAYFRSNSGLARSFTVRSGSTIVRWNSYAPGVTHVARVFDRRDVWLDSASQLLHVSRSLDSGQARVVGGRGLQARGRLRAELSLDREADVGPDTRLYAELDRSTFLPVSFTVVAGGATETLRVVARTMKASAATRALFTVRRPWTLRDTRMRYGDLATRVAFPVYTLGGSYGGLRFGNAGLHETTEKTRTFRLQPALLLTYTRAGRNTEPELTLTEHAAGTADANARLAAFRTEGRAYRMKIVGATRTVYLLDEDRRPVYFAAVVGRTLVKGRANMSREQVLAALAQLRRVS